MRGCVCLGCADAVAGRPGDASGLCRRAVGSRKGARANERGALRARGDGNGCVV